MKLHLGCGGTYLEGYINIDFPTDDKTIMKVRADLYQDIRTLDYPAISLDEIRNHHVFEHFDRVDALRMLFRWRKWLKIGGKLVIETPDFLWCSLLFTIVPYNLKMKLGRHIFGTQEAAWANHLDFWYKGKFRHILSKFGFGNFKFSHPIYRNLLPNIKVECFKNKEDVDEETVIKEILENYILRLEDKDKFLRNWLEK